MEAITEYELASVAVVNSTITATASLRVRDEIVVRLMMRDPYVVVRGFDRPNIWLGAKTFYDEAEKLPALQMDIICRTIEKTVVGKRGQCYKCCSICL